MKAVISGFFIATLLFSDLCLSAEWSHNKSAFDKHGQVTLKDAEGNVWSENNEYGYKGFGTTSSPTVLNITVGSSDTIKIYDLYKSPPTSNYIHNLSEPMKIGQLYEISGFHHRTGGSGSSSVNECVPTWDGKRIIKYTGPGQTFRIASGCKNQEGKGFISSSDFVIVNDSRIENVNSYDATNYNEYYGYEHRFLSSVKTTSSEEIFSARESWPSSNYIHNLSKPLVVGKKYEFWGYFYRTGGSGSAENFYKCVPISIGKGSFEYMGPGQKIRFESRCLTRTDGSIINRRVSVFTIINSTRIEADSSYDAWNFNDYYGYDQHIIESVVML